VKLGDVPWRVTAGRVVVNGLALALVVVSLPGIKGYAAHPLVAYLVLGALFGLLNAFVKPLVQFVALPLLLGSFGLVVIGIDILLFWILQQLTPLLGSSSLLWMALAGVLLGLLTGFFDNVLGLVPPISSDAPTG
jgi:putative membrane protein